jgi:hypothetical protein
VSPKTNNKLKTGTCFDRADCLQVREPKEATAPLRAGLIKQYLSCTQTELPVDHHPGQNIDLSSLKAAMSPIRDASRETMEQVRIEHKCQCTQQSPSPLPTRLRRSSRALARQHHTGLMSCPSGFDTRGLADLFSPSTVAQLTACGFHAVAAAMILETTCMKALLSS